MKKEPTIEYAHELCKISKRDLNDLRVMKDLSSDENFGFFAQQAVEKALKSWLTINLIKIEYTHNLETLYDQIVLFDKRVEEFSGLIFLTPFSVLHRYVFAGYDEALDRNKVIEDIEKLVAKL